MFHFLGCKILRYGVFILALSAVACASSPTLSNGGDLSMLKQSLAAIKGRFNWLPDHGYYEYSQRQELIDLVLAQTPGARRDHLSVETLSGLVDCLDDSSLSVSVFADKPVPVGWVCHATLTGFVYHEEVDADGDIVPDWAGYPSLPASPQDMRAAKSAWKKAISSKQYSFL
jgi:hypothetical protein